MNDLVDDFVVDLSSISNVQRSKGKIERLFGVVIEFGNTGVDDKNREKQWVGLEGEPSNRRNAKEYIIALCHPEDKIKMKYPPRLFSAIDDNTLSRIEAQTHAAIGVLNDSELTIAGTDLGVTLAMSAIEDFIQREGQTEVMTQWSSPAEVSETRKEKRLSSEAAMRLDKRFERALSENSDGTCTSKDYECAPDAVKRVMLQCWSEENGMGQIQHDRAEQMQTDSPAGFNQRSSPSSSNDILVDEHQVNEVDSVNSANNGNSRANVAQAVQGKSGRFNLQDFAKQCGYCDEDIHAVLSRGSENMTPKEFLTRLYENKALKSTCKQKESDSQLFGLGNSNTDNSKQSTSEVINSKSDSFRENTRRSSSEVLNSKEAIAGSPSVDYGRYLQRLARDFEEEDHTTDINELKQRNAERQQLFKSALSQQRNQESSYHDAGSMDSSPSKQQVKRAKKKKGKTSPSPIGLRSGDRSNSKSRNRPQGGRNLNSPVLADLKDERTDGGRADSSDFFIDLTDEGTALDKLGDETCLMKVWQPSLRSDSVGRGHLSRRDFEEEMSQHVRGLEKMDCGGTAFRGKHPGSTQQHLRHIVIDGSNVAMTHGNHKYFSCLGIQICVNYFLSRGHTEVTAFVPQWRCKAPTPKYPIQNQQLLEMLRDQGHLVFTPSRKVDGRNIVCYDDRYVLKLAEQTDGVIVSNDNYRDLMIENPGWKRIIEERLLMYSFVGDLFMPPDDPLGRDGPCLNDFLAKIPQVKFKRAFSPSPQFTQRPGRGNFKQQNHHQQRQQPWHSRQNQTPGRSQEETDHIATLLRNLFPNTDQEEKIRKVLQNHRSETNLNKLSNYIMNIS